MLRHRDALTLLTFLGEAIELEGRHRERDKGRENRRFYQLVDLRNRFLAASWPVSWSAGHPAPLCQLTMRLGRWPTFGLN